MTTAALALLAAMSVEAATGIHFQQAEGMRQIAEGARCAAIVFRDDEDILKLCFRDGELDVSAFPNFCWKHECVFRYCEQVSNRCPDLP